MRSPEGAQTAWVACSGGPGPAAYGACGWEVAVPYAAGLPVWAGFVRLQLCLATCEGCSMHCCALLPILAMQRTRSWWLGGLRLPGPMWASFLVCQGSCRHGPGSGSGSGSGWRAMQVFVPHGLEGFFQVAGHRPRPAAGSRAALRHHCSPRTVPGRAEEVWLTPCGWQQLNVLPLLITSVTGHDQCKHGIVAEKQVQR